MKVFNAKIDGGAVFIVDGDTSTLVPDSEKLCQGVAPSEGKLLINEKFAFYVANTQPDTEQIKSLLTDVVNLCAIIGETAAVIGSPVNAAAAAQLRTIQAQLETMVLI